VSLGILDKNQHIRDKVKAEVKGKKQPKIDDIIYQFDVQKSKSELKTPKTIVINNIASVTLEDELALKIGFSLLPSISYFSKIKLDLFFQEELLNSVMLGIPQSSLLKGSLEFPQILDMKGIAAGDYLVRVEMYEPWSSGEKLNFTFKEISVHYTPQTREDRLVKIPTVKSVAGSDLLVISSTAKDIYSEIDESQRKESINKRDQW
jgi:hypothetical protein